MPDGSWAPGSAASGFLAAEASLLSFHSQACFLYTPASLLMHTTRRREVPAARLLLGCSNARERASVSSQVGRLDPQGPCPVGLALEGSCLRCAYQHSCGGHHREEGPKGHSRTWEPKSQAGAGSGHPPQSPGPGMGPSGLKGRPGLDSLLAPLLMVPVTSSSVWLPRPQCGLTHPARLSVTPNERPAWMGQISLPSDAAMPV